MEQDNNASTSQVPENTNTLIFSSSTHSRILANNTIESQERTDKLYAENKILYPYKDFSQLRPHKGADSHIFDTGKEPYRRPGKKILQIKDSVMFNDNYKENTKTFTFQKRRVNDNCNTDNNTGSRVFPTAKDAVTNE